MGGWGDDAGVWFLGSRRAGPREDRDDFGIDLPEPEDGSGEDGDDGGQPEDPAAWADLLGGIPDEPPAEGDADPGPLPTDVFDLVGDDEGDGPGGETGAGDLAGEDWGELVGDDGEDGGAEADGGPGADLDDAWFIESDTLDADPDGGDGPVDDRVEDIDEGGWDELDEPEDDDELPVERAMALLGMELPAEPRSRPAATRLEGDAVRELRFLGPREGTAVAIAVGSGAPVAAGDELYVTGADGLLYETGERLPGFATSVCVQDGAIVVGTGTAGAFRFDRPSAGPEPVNGWSTAGLVRAAGPEVSTSISVFTGRAAGAPLFGLTGEGQLFASRDGGDHWAGPLTDGPCLAATADEETGELVALVDRARELCLVRGLPGRLRIVHVADPPAGIALRAGVPRLAAAGGTVVALPAGPGAAPLLWTGEGGLLPLAAATGATAVALDPEDPSWIAAAFFDPDEGRAEVRFSDDGGASFCRVLIVEPGEDDASPAVTALALEPGAAPRLYAVTGRGVVRLTLRRPPRGH